MQVPTILIGLGGTGSKIVDKIYSWVPENRRDFVAIHAFDTDVNDISKLKNLKRDNITQTSTQYTVGQYIDISDSSVREWFPHDIPELKRKNLTDGAGQIRTVSRLAYRSAMEATDSFASLRDSISRIVRLCADQRLSSLRVVIVTTLAGGTGSGIFLQTAMFLREMINIEFNMQNVLIRGVFLMPDTLVLSRKVSASEYDNVMSNAYASLKELNAIIRVTSGGRENVQIEMEYKPNQVDTGGRPALNLGFSNLPYDYCVLFDYENTNGNNLGAFENYMALAARTTYFDLFTPMAENLFSRQDNQIRSLVANQGLNRFCSSGLATLVYPYNDIVNYQTLSWITSILSDQWLYTDQKVKEEFMDREHDINKGIVRESFNYEERFNKNINDSSATAPFFKSIVRDAHITDQDNQIIGSKAEQFLIELDKEINNLYLNDPTLTQKENSCTVREHEIKEKTTCMREVNRVEMTLRSLKNDINTFVSDNKSMLANKVLFADSRNIMNNPEFDFASYNPQNSHELNYWILNARSPMHPVAVRYTINELINLITNETDKLNGEIKILEEKITKYENEAYDIPDTESVKESATDRVRIALRQGFFDKIFSTNEFKSFNEEYIEKSGIQLSNLKTYKIKKLRLSLYEILLKHLRELNEDFKRFFSALENIKVNLKNELNTSALTHEQSNDPTFVYVLARKEEKETQWNSLKPTYMESGIPGDVSKQIYMSMYLRLCKKAGGHYTSALHDETVSASFSKNVIEWCRKKLYAEPNTDLSILDALKKEAETNGINENHFQDYFVRKIQQLETLSNPFILRPANVQLAEISAWGMHPANSNYLTGEFIENAFRNNNPIIEDSFSKYEIIKEKLVYGLRAEDLIKFAEPGGRYYQAYRRILNGMRQNSSVITPHLDKRWHLPAYLCSLTDREITIEEENIRKSFVVGLSLGLLKQLDEYGKKCWFYISERGELHIINTATDTAAGSKTYELLKALYYNPALVDKILNRYEVIRENEKSSIEDIVMHTFSNNIKSVSIAGVSINLIQLILSFPDGNSGDPKLPEVSWKLLSSACEEIKNYFIHAIGTHRLAMAETQYKAFIKELIDNASHYQKADKSSAVFAQWDGILRNYI